MPITVENHRAAVANYLAGKVREFGYHLREVVEAADRSLASFANGQPHPAEGPINYYFSAFGNAMQSLKDVFGTIHGSPLTWREIRQISYGAFMAESRNAMTHDGDPVISGWVDGHYYVANNISRFGLRGQLIEIERPTIDVRTLCLAFADEFCALLLDRMKPLVGRYQILGTALDVSQLVESVHESDLVPQFVKDMVAEKSDEIRDAISRAPPFDPVEKAIEELEAVRDYCSAKRNDG